MVNTGIFQAKQCATLYSAVKNETGFKNQSKVEKIKKISELYLFSSQHRIKYSIYCTLF